MRDLDLSAMPVGVCDFCGGAIVMLPLYRDPHFVFRFAEDRIVPRFHLEGVEAGVVVGVYALGAASGEPTSLIASATAGDGGWVDLAVPIIVRAGGGFVAVTSDGG